MGYGELLWHLWKNTSNKSGIFNGRSYKSTRLETRITVRNYLSVKHYCNINDQKNESYQIQEFTAHAWTNFGGWKTVVSTLKQAV